MRRNRFYLGLLAAASVLMTGCLSRGGDAYDNSVTNVYPQGTNGASCTAIAGFTSATSITLGVGATSQIVYTAGCVYDFRSANLAVATVTSGGLITGVGGGTTTVCAYYQNAPVWCVTVVVTAGAARVDSVTISPKSAVGVVGGTLVLTARVWGNPTPLQSVTWSVPLTDCFTYTIDGVYMTLKFVKACSAVPISATSTVDPTKSGTSSVSVSSGVINCTPIVIGATVSNGAITTTASSFSIQFSCVNQNGVHYLPYWYTDHTEILSVLGTQQVKINNITFTAGDTATIKRVFAGTAVVTAQLAITDQTIITSFKVTFVGSAPLMAPLQDTVVPFPAVDTRKGIELPVIRPQQ